METGGLMQRLQAGDVRALARALSVVEDGSAGAAEVVAACRAVAAQSHTLRVGITGPPGAGKSTLTDALVRLLRAEGRTVAVLAFDPSSPRTGGALLGDRIRMQGYADDEWVYIRSVASRGAMGGVTAGAEALATVVEAAGWDVLLMETVGVGQDEVAIAGVADCVVLVLVPGAGDEVQSLKAGVMEIADVYAVNKADLPGADAVERELAAVASLAPDTPRVPMVRTVAATGEGVEALLAAVRGCVPRRRAARGAGAVPGADTLRGAGLKIDHLGIAVRSIAAARVFYEALGLSVAAEETVEHERARTAMLPVGTARLELLEPLGEDSVVGRFVARRGEGLHHVALAVDDLDTRFAKLRAAGVRLASDCVRMGAGGHRYFFVHPESTGGVLLELVEAGGGSA